MADNKNVEQTKLEETRSHVGFFQRLFEWQVSKYFHQIHVFHFNWWKYVERNLLGHSGIWAGIRNDHSADCAMITCHKSLLTKGKIRFFIMSFEKIPNGMIGWNPWSIGFGRRLVFKRSWVWIPALDTGCTNFHINLLFKLYSLLEKVQK